MSVLELSGRPFTVFDPANKAHRSYYHAFVETGSWGKCPYRFVVPEDHGDLITMIQRCLVKHYVQSEFKPVAKKPQRSKIGQVADKLVARKNKKTVDN